ncbi:MAG: hypothetical protein IKO72_12285 [Kiritimatiellae bacterium]|nr:hypothetical protein [Kiritimatiellia bacterium]
MASRIELEFGGKYSVGEKFAQLDKDIKGSGKNFKDMGQAAKSVASEIAGAFGGKLNSTIGTSLSLFQEMARGGIWGAMSVAANTAISFIAAKWTEAKEAARKYAELCRTEIVNGMKSVVDGFGGVSKAISNVNAEAKELMAVTNGEVATRAELKVHEINVKALQSITDEMTAATRSAIMAQAALEQAEVRAAAATEQAANARQAAVDAEAQIRQKREAAEAALGEAQARRAEFEEKARSLGTGWMARYEELQAQASQSVEQLMAGGLALEQALAWRKSASLALAKFEEEHKEEIGALNEVTKLEAAARENLEAAKREETSAANAVTLASQKEEVARAAAADMVQQATSKYQDANAALDKETEARAAAAEAAEREGALQNEIERIKAVCLANDVEYAEYVELYTTAIKDGMLQQTANTLLQKKLNEELKKRAEQVKAENEGKGGAAGSSTANLTKAIKDAIKDTPVITNVNAAGVGDGVDKSDEVITLGKLQHDVRDEQRKGRNHLDAVKQSSAAMQAYLKGQMSPEVAAAFEQKMKANGWTMKDFGAMTEKSLKAQLLSVSQQKEQHDAIVKMQKNLEKLGLK